MQIRNLPRSGQLSFQGTLSMCQVIKLGQPQNLETRIQIPESGFRNQKPESGNWKPESGIKNPQIKENKFFKYANVF